MAPSSVRRRGGGGPPPPFGERFNGRAITYFLAIFLRHFFGQIFWHFFLAAEVRRCPPRSEAPRWRSGDAHCDLQLTDEICNLKLAKMTANKNEDEKEKKKEKKEVERTALIKSNNPDLTGWEQTNRETSANGCCNAPQEKIQCVQTAWHAHLQACRPSNLRHCVPRIPTPGFGFCPAMLISEPPNAKSRISGRTLSPSPSIWLP